MKIVPAAANSSDFLKVFAEYLALEPIFGPISVISVCPIFIEGQIVAKLESSANESRVPFTDE